ncbi:alpha/beta fold hydrolase [Streptomyces sp. NBC_01525]|uniref:alpha/beta hydrolase family protein n=1 Tax=Streptomyces sp. NBC_01525 TaxID=2903893 RepID=UPI00386E1C17
MTGPPTPAPPAPDDATTGPAALPADPDVRRITLDGAGIPLSALLAEPRHAPPRAVVVAVHGGGMRAGYFHGRAHPTLSLLDLGARLGYTVLALDRPGYGASAGRLPLGQGLAEQSATLAAALTAFADGHRTGTGFFAVAHSYGGKLALRAAAEGAFGPDLIGVDVSGIGHRPAVDFSRLSASDGRPNGSLHWGPLSLYPPGTFRLAGTLVTPMPEREVREMAHWPEQFAGIATRIRVPVRFTFAEHERWWRHDGQTVAAMTALFTGATVTVDRQLAAGHNISLGWAARSYHLRALGFLEECVTARRARLR